MDQETAARPYFPPLYLAAYVVLGVVGIFLRFYGIGDRPLHHDESIHAMFGKYFFDAPDYHFYKYDPTYHGPLLYHLFRAIFTPFGATNFSIRMPMALIGSGMIFFPLLYRKYFSPGVLLTLTSLIALSPTLIYWSRFAREDYMVIFGLMLMLYGITHAATERKPFWVFFGITIQLCSKENFYVTGALVIGYIVYESLSNLLLPQNAQTLASNLLSYIKGHVVALHLALIPALFLYCYLFSAGFRYGDGPLDLFRLGFKYWFQHHQQQRIEGPFLFLVYMFAWYEIPFLALFLVHLAIFYRRARLLFGVIFGLSVLLGLGLAMPYFGAEPPDINKVGLYSFFKLKDGLDIVGLPLLLIHPILVTTHHLLKRERLLALWGYLFTASFFTYSYLGEKVPWLATYALIPGIIYLVLFFEKYWFESRRERVLQMPWGKILLWSSGVLLFFGTMMFLEDGLLKALASSPLTSGKIFNCVKDYLSEPCVWLGIAMGVFALLANDTLGTCHAGFVAFVAISLFNLNHAIITNFTKAGEASEYISQVHTTWEFDRAISEARLDIESPLHQTRPLILVIDDPVWPATWYLRDLPEYKFSATEQEKSQFKYIFQNYDEGPPPSLPGFETKKLTLRGWWVPEFRQMTLRKFMNYALTHEPWSDTGFTYTYLLTKTEQK